MALMVNLKIICLFLFVLIVSKSVFGLDDSFPHRETYKHIPIISPEELYSQFDEFVIVDVRSWDEYNIINILNSYNIELSKHNFVTLVSEIIKSKPAKIAVYCNGHQCKKSYLAAEKLLKNKISVFAMDSGVFDWVRLYPEKTNLLGENPANLAKLISQDEFNVRLLTQVDFEKKLVSFIESGHDVLILDIREPFQRKVSINSVSGVSVRRIAFSNFISAIQMNRVGINNKVLFIFDATGRQVYWAQYYLN